MYNTYAIGGCISTHAPAGGATCNKRNCGNPCTIFLLTPLREGRRILKAEQLVERQFLLTPLREGRRSRELVRLGPCADFYSRPCGRGDDGKSDLHSQRRNFYSRPCGRGDRCRRVYGGNCADFYSRPCGRGDAALHVPAAFLTKISTHAPAGGATREEEKVILCRRISTHAPAGGATAIFHKSVMRFCGKLPKDDTVLCLASFGFPRRDPKAVYLAWISCANLPQKCVRQGLALKDQGTSCFHEGLASHAFDPVLV